MSTKDTRPRADADRDSWFTRMIRFSRHPLRIFAMSIAAFCLTFDLAMTTGITAAILGTIVGVASGEILARTRFRLSWLIGGFASIALLMFFFAWATVQYDWLVELFGTGGALHMVSFLRYGAAAFFASASMRAAAKRYPSWIALELATIVLSVAVAVASHRHGAIAQPRWLSDYAWQRGIEPSTLLIAMGVVAALVAVSLLLLERKGRLSIAALPLIPLVAILGVSCFEVTRGADEQSEASPDVTDEEGDEPNETDEGRPEENGEGGDGGDRGMDGGVPRDGGGGGPGDGGRSDGGAGRGDGAVGEGGAGGGGEGGVSEGGTGEGGMPDADLGDDDAWDAGEDDSYTWDAGPSEQHEPEEGNTEQQEQQEEQPQEGEQEPSDIGETPPPTGQSAAQPVAVVIFERDYSSPTETYYFRQEAWSRFENHRLVPARDIDRDVVDRMPAGRTVVGDPPPMQGRGEVLALVALVVEHEIPFALEGPVWFEDARNPNPQRFRRAYRFMSRSQTIDLPDLRGRRAGNPAWTDEVRAVYLEQHPDPRFREWSEETIAELPASRRDDPFSRAVAIKLRMDSLLTYSTRERHADAEDATVDFFFGNRIGYCVHFAHAAVFNYRSVGIPARVGVGYMTPESSREGGSSLVLKSGDAHAWPEIYLEGVGWIVLDIAAAQNLDPPVPPIDPEVEEDLEEMAREEPPDPEDEIREPEPPSAFARILRKVPWGWGILGMIVTIILAILVFLFMLKLWRRLAPSLASAKALPRVHYRASLDRLAELGISREYGETLEEFAKRVAQLSPGFEKVTEQVLTAGLAPPAREDQDRAKWSKMTAAVKQDIKKGVPAWRRVVGVLHPLAFLDSR
jgi:transglutaminase-like putative cysteine protease